MAGQGTVGLELMEQAAEIGAGVDAVLAAASGGGLVAGVGLAVKAARPDAEIWCVDPDGYDDHARSLAAGDRVGIPIGRPSLADALLAEPPRALTLEVHRRHPSLSLIFHHPAPPPALSTSSRPPTSLLYPGGAATP